MFVSLLTLLFAGIMFATHDIGGSQEETENDQSDEREEDPPVEGEAPDTVPDPEPDQDTEPDMGASILEEDGTVTIELGEDETGSLLAVSFEDEYVPNDDGSSGGSAYSLVLYLVPEGVEVPTSRAEIAADLDDDPDNPLEEYDVTWQAVVEEYGLVRLESWNLGRIGSDHAAFYDGGEPAYWTSLVHPPELVSDASLDFLTVRGDDGALASVEAANAPLGLSNETLTIRYHSELGTGGDDTGETPNNGSFTNILTENVPSGGIFSAGDGNDAILAAPGSSVPIVIVTGQGEDEVTVGLNQTVVTGNLPDTYSEGDSLKEQSFDDTGGDIINVQIVDLDHATDDIEREIFADENDTVRYSVPTYGDAPAGSLVLIEAESVVIETGTDVEQGAYTTTLTEQSVHVLFVPAVDGSAITSLPDTTSLSELLEAYDAIQLDTFRTGLVESTLYEGTDTPEIIDMRNAYSAPVITSHLNVIYLRASELPQQAA